MPHPYDPDPKAPSTTPPLSCLTLTVVVKVAQGRGISPPKIRHSANWFQTSLSRTLLGKVATFGTMYNRPDLKFSTPSRSLPVGPPPVCFGEDNEEMHPKPITKQGPTVLYTRHQTATMGGLRLVDTSQNHIFRQQFERCFPPLQCTPLQLELRHHCSIEEHPVGCDVSSLRLKSRSRFTRLNTVTKNR